MDTFWLSFTDDDGFKGVVIGEGDSFTDVVSECWRRGCNPGGQVASQVFPPLSDVPLDHPERAEIERTLCAAALDVVVEGAIVGTDRYRACRRYVR